MTPGAHNQPSILVYYDPADRAWLQRELVPGLLQAGLRFQTEHRAAQTSGLALPASSEQIVVLLLSAQSSSTLGAFNLAAPPDRPAGQRAFVVQLERCPIPAHLASLRRFDLSNPATRPCQLRRLLRMLAPKCRIAFAYAADAEPDASLARELAACFAQAGYQVADTARAGSRLPDLENSDVLIIMFSSTAAQSEILADIIANAQRRFSAQGRPRLLPVWLGGRMPLPYTLAEYLDRQPWLAWHGPADTRRLLVQLCDAINLQATPSQPTLASPGQANAHATAPAAAPIAPATDFYIERDADVRLHNLLARDTGLTITIRGPYQSGKTALLARGLAQAQRGRTVFIDLQQIDPAFLVNLNRLLYQLAVLCFDQLQIPQPLIRRAWASPLPAGIRLTNLIEDELLSAGTKRITVVFDEADRLIDAPYRDSFFGMLRAWHSNRALKPIWQRLDIVMVITAEPNALIQDVNQSPFNVGDRIELDDFSLAQTTALSMHYQVQLTTSDLLTIQQLLAGHPFLTTRIFSALAARSLAWPQLAGIATAQLGPFDDHLRRYLTILQAQPELGQALKQVISQGTCTNERDFFRLLQLGLIKGIDAEACECRCRLYAEYFQQHL